MIVLRRMVGSVECFYGPDGVGKTTFLKHAAADDPSIVVLHGSDFDAWGRRNPALRAEGLIPERFPGPDDVLDRIDVVTGVSDAIARQGYHVKVDGHPAHSTAINVAAGLLAVGDMAAGTPMEVLLSDSPLAKRFLQLKRMGLLVTHACVDLPMTMTYQHAAGELQRRIHSRKRSPGELEPRTKAGSAAQMDATWLLTSGLSQRGHAIRYVRPPISRG